MPRSDSEDRTRSVPQVGRLPRHVAIIMDGNGRWARQRGKNRLAGHKAGVEAVREVVKAAAESGIEVLTLFAFSTENWSRPRSEVEGLWRLLIGFLDRRTHELAEHGVRLKWIGRRERLPGEVVAALERAESATSSCTKMTLCLALNYGGQDELVDAARAIARDAISGVLRPEDIDRETIEKRLYTAGLPPVDLLIRTGGEQRVSNFLLWQISYAELYFSRVYWPDFTRAHFVRALEAFAERERRFGGI